MAQRKPYNPNTKYGRRKLREQTEIYKQNLSPEERAKFESESRWVYIIIVIVVGAIIYMCSGSDGLRKWMQR